MSAQNPSYPPPPDEQKNPRAVEPLELATLLIRHYGIHHGLWTLEVHFHASGHNFTPAGDTAAVPAALVTVRSIGLRQVSTADGLTIDAAAVNPPRDSRKYS